MAEVKRRGRQPAKNEIAAALIKALGHVGIVKPETGTAAQPYMTHVYLGDGWAVTYDGILAAGHPIPADINGYVDTKLLGEALANTGKQFSLTVQESGAFEIVSGNYTSLVPALSPDQIIPTPPDAMQAPLTMPTAFCEALDKTSRIISDKADKIVYASIRLNNGTVMATSGQTLLEVFHGNYMPVGVVLPQRFAAAVVKLKKELLGFGLSADWSTFTVYFTDGSWLRTNTYTEGWPQPIIDAYTSFFEGVDVSQELPSTFAHAARTVFPFTTPPSHRLIVRPGLIRTHPDRRMGAALEVKELDFTADLPGKNVLAVVDQIKKFGMAKLPSGLPYMVFYGENVRGVIAGMEPEPEPEYTAPASHGTSWADIAKTAAPAPQAAPAPGWAAPGATAFTPPQQQQPAQQPQEPAQEVPAFKIGTVAPEQPAQPAQAPAAAPQPTTQAAPLAGWLGGPPEGLASDPEFLEGAGFGSEGTGQFAHPAESVTPTSDTGVDFSGGFNSEAWLAEIAELEETENEE